MIKKALFLLLLCKVFICFSQEEDIKKLSAGACECVRDIRFDISQEEFIQKINSCIEDEIRAVRVRKTIELLINKRRDSLSKGDSLSKKENKKINDSLVVVFGDELNIYTDKYFKDVQSDLLENCPEVRELLKVKNKKLKNSISKNKKAVAFYDKGNTFYGNRKYEQALVHYNKAVQVDPNFAFAWDNMGICHKNLGNYESAIQCYKISLKLDPTGKMPLMNMAVAYELLEDYKNAALTYDHYKLLHQGDPEGPYGASRMYFVLEDYEKAVDNIFMAYLGYFELKSPYVKDAEQVMYFIHQELSKKGKLDILKEAAKKYNIEINIE